MIVDDTSTDVEALRDELKFELVVLHSEVKKLDKNWDYSGIITPLMDDQGPPLNVVRRIQKLIEQLRKLRVDFHQTARDLQRPAAALAEAAQSLYVAVPPNTKKGRPVKPKPQPRRHLPPDFVIEEVTPSWGDCKRYCAMDEKQYHWIVAIAKYIYDMILQSPDPCKFPQKELPANLLSAVTKPLAGISKHQGCGTKPKFLLD